MIKEREMLMRGQIIYKGQHSCVDLLITQLKQNEEGFHFDLTFVKKSSIECKMPL